MAVEVTVDPEVAQKVDRNGDGHISQEEMEMNWNLKEKNLKMQMLVEMRCVR